MPAIITENLIYTKLREVTHIDQWSGKNRQQILIDMQKNPEFIKKFTMVNGVFFITILSQTHSLGILHEKYKDIIEKDKEYEVKKFYITGGYKNPNGHTDEHGKELHYFYGCNTEINL